MTTVPVQLVNTTDHDIQIGSGTSQIIARAHGITDADLDNRGFAAWTLLTSGVALIPRGIPLSSIWAEQPTEEHDVLTTNADEVDATPKVQTAPAKQRHRRAKTHTPASD